MTVTAGSTTDRFNPSVATRATGQLRVFNTAGVLTAADVHVAARLGRLGGEEDEAVLLAVALTVRALRAGSTCLDLSTAAATEFDEDVDRTELRWPDPPAWVAACRSSPLTRDGSGAGGDAAPLRLVGDLLYLDRYWQQEQQIRAELARRVTMTPPAVGHQALRAALGTVFPGASAPDHQLLAAAAVTSGWLTVVAGGPGTGKTTAVRQLLAVLDAVAGPQRVALAAPTGRAAARLSEAVGREATTLHRLLGWRPGGGGRFRHDRNHRLPHDAVVVDETSMVSLTLMARLLEAVRPDARLVLVGDPDQLASVEAGAVLGDLVGRPARPAADERERLLLDVLEPDCEPRADVVGELRTDVVRLRRTHRYRGAIAALAEAVRTGDAETAVEVLSSGEPGVTLVTADAQESSGGLAELRADAVQTGRAVHAAAVAGDVALALRHLARHRLLCAHRRGPYGVARWAAEVERWLVADVPGYAGDGEWYRGRPLLVTANDNALGLYNGDAGVVVDDGTGGVLAAFSGAHGPVALPPGRLSAVQTVHAMTVHKSQGSQFEQVTVLLPPAESPLLTRELLYTAVTRAQEAVRVIGSEQAVRAAVSRPVSRASGLRRPT